MKYGKIGAGIIFCLLMVFGIYIWNNRYAEDVVYQGHLIEENIKGYTIQRAIDNISDVKNLIKQERIKIEKELEEYDYSELIAQILHDYTEYEIVDFEVAARMSKTSVEAFVLTATDEVLYEYTDIAMSETGEWEEVLVQDALIEGWYINGTTARRVFSNNQLEDGSRFTNEDLTTSETWLAEYYPLEDGTKMVGVRWSISPYNDYTYFFLLEDDSAKYVFSLPDGRVTEEGKIISSIYGHIDSNIYFDNTEYEYKAGELVCIETWVDYME